MSESENGITPKITIKKNGPYKVVGKIPSSNSHRFVRNTVSRSNGNSWATKLPRVTRTSFAAAASLPLTHSAMAAIKRASTDLKLPAPTVLPCAFSPIADRALQ